MIRETGRAGLPTSAGCSYSDERVLLPDYMPSRTHQIASAVKACHQNVVGCRCSRVSCENQKKRKKSTTGPCHESFYSNFRSLSISEFSVHQLWHLPGVSRGRFSTTYYNQDFVLISCLFPCLWIHCFKPNNAKNTRFRLQSPSHAVFPTYYLSDTLSVWYAQTFLAFLKYQSVLYPSPSPHARMKYRVLRP